MANWDRTYNTPTVIGEPYTVTISCPASWRPLGQTRPNLTANRIGTVPNERYEITYEKKGTSAAMNDVWKIGALTFQGGNIRNPEVKLLATTPPSTTLSSDRPAVRDGNGSGGGDGTIVVDIPGTKPPKRLKGTFKFVDVKVVGIEGPIKAPIKKGAKAKG